MELQKTRLSLRILRLLNQTMPGNHAGPVTISAVGMRW